MTTSATAVTKEVHCAAKSFASRPRARASAPSTSRIRVGPRCVSRWEASMPRVVALPIELLEATGKEVSKRALTMVLLPEAWGPVMATTKKGSEES